jgi:pyruvate dehydrogenase E1 component beta subunit
MVVFAEKALDSLAPQGVVRHRPAYDLAAGPQDHTAGVESTGRLIVVDESPPRCSVASDIAALVASQGFDSLQAPVELVTTPHAPVPFSPALERAYVPSPQKIAAAISRTLRARR